MLVDIGFSPTFSRVIAYAMGGAEIIVLKNPTDKNFCRPNWTAIEEIYSTMRYIYVRLNIFWIFLLITLGTWSVFKPISLVNNTYSAWVAWGVIIAVSAITFWGNTFNSYLKGVNKVALLRRWQTITSIGAIITSCLVLMCGGGLLGMVVAHQGWQTLNIFRNLVAIQKCRKRSIKKFLKKRKNKQVFKAVWPSSWRGGIGIFMSYGLIQASGILYAQIEKAASVATYLLALRLIQTVNQFFSGPFLQQLPALARLFSEGKKNNLEQLGKKGDDPIPLDYVLGFIVLGIIGGPLLKFIGSNAEFPTSNALVFVRIGFFC